MTAAPSAWPVDGLTAWAGEWFDRQELKLREADAVRAMPWASVVCFEFDGDVRPPVMWGKAMSPALAVEIDVLPLLARVAPWAVVDPLAADRERGYLLLPDGGPTLSDVLPHDALPLWRNALASYARLQHAASVVVPELLAAGVTDLRPTAAADAVEWLADRDELHEVEAPHGLTPSEVERLREVAVPGARAVAALLSDAVVAPTVQHDDLQPSNALTDGRWVDWGDASVAHPFASLLTALDGRPAGPAGRRAPGRCARCTSACGPS